MSYLSSSSQPHFSQHQTPDSSGQRRQGQQQRPSHTNENTNSAPQLYQRSSPPSSPLDDGYVLEESNAASHDPAVLPYHEATLLNSLRYQLSEIKSPLENQLDDIVHFFDSIKKSEKDLKRILSTYPTAQPLKQLQGQLSTFLVDFNSALQLQAARPQLMPIHFTHEQVQTVCQGLAVCAPPTRGLLFHKQRATCNALQGLTDTLLTSAMALGLPEALQANGEVLDILNWLSRGLKAGLLKASEPIDRCFEKSLMLIGDWTGGDQCHQLLTDHNLGRCAVQLATIINHTNIDLLAASANDLQNEESPATNKAPTNGELLQNSILNLCSPAVLKRLMTAPVDTVSLLNLCNTVKDAIDKKVLAAHDPLLLPALEQLIKAIAGLKESELIGSDSDCRPLANFSNFLRELAEHEVNQKHVFQAALSMLDPACEKLIACINSDAFRDAYPESQSLSNLISFVKLRDKRLMQRNAVTTSSAATTFTPTRSPEQIELINAGKRLTDGVVGYGASYFKQPAALSGLLAGLAYLWQRNLVPMTPEMRAMVQDLLNLIAETKEGTWNVQSKKVVLPALQGLLQLGVIMYADDTAQSALRYLMPASVSQTGLITLKQISNENKRLGAIEEVVIALPMAAHIVATNQVTNTTAATSTAANNGTSLRSIPGLTTIRAQPPLVTNLNSKRTESSLVSGSPSSPPSSSSNNSSSSNMAAKPYQEPKKIARQNKLTVEVGKHSHPVVINRKSTIQELAKKQREKDEKEKKEAQKNEQPRKQTEQKKQAQIRNGKSGKSGKAAPSNKQAALCKAIIAGKAGEVTKQMHQIASWSAYEITSLLDAVMSSIDLIDTKIIDALGVFFTAIQAARKEEGKALLTAYFNDHPTSFAGLQSLLIKQKLVAVKPQFESATTAEEFFSFMDAFTEKDWGDQEKIANTSKYLDQLFQKGINTLYLGIKNKRLPTIAKLVKIPAAENLSLQKYEGSTPLMLAASEGYTDIVRLLLSMPSADAQVKAVNMNGLNALMIAVLHARTGVVELLLDMSSAAEQAKAITKSGWNALIIAAHHGHTRVVERLLGTSSAAEQAKAITISGWNALMNAADEGHAGVVERLLAVESATDQANVVDRNRFNALMLAAKQGNTDVVSCLLSMTSADEQAAAVDINKWSPLIRAAYEGHTDVVKCLLNMPSADAQVAAVNKDGWNPLMMAAHSGHIGVVERLLAMGSAAEQANAVNKDKLNALQLAKKNNLDAIVTLLKPYAAT